MLSMGHRPFPPGGVLGRLRCFLLRVMAVHVDLSGLGPSSQIPVPSLLPFGGSGRGGHGVAGVRRCRDGQDPSETLG